MPRHIPVLVATASIVFVLAAADRAQAQVSIPQLNPVATQASVHAGRIKGVVRDDVGQTVRGVSVVAMGTILAASKSDERGSFSLALPPGEYILRATCDGYLSTYREPVRIQTSVLLERDITLTRQGVTPSARQTLLTSAAGGGQAREPDTVELGRPDHVHSEVAWRLRHLTRSVLRDGAPADVAGVTASNRSSFTPRASFFDRAVEGSARLASAFFLGTDFDGQVNFLTTSVLNHASGWVPEEWPRGVAYIAVGAPVGAHGNWRMRGAITAGDASSWVVLGEYRARDEATHAVRFGVSYSAQGYGYSPHSTERWLAATTEARNVAGVYGFDRWRVRPALTLDYGLRVDRYDYVAAPELVSPQVGARVEVLPRTFVLASASRRMIAPGADEFLPPASSGLWMPPERTFSSLIAGVPLRAEEVRHLEMAFEHQLGADPRRAVLVRRFHQSSINQVATLFGRDAASDVGHYYVASPGSVNLDGWGMRVTARLTRRFEGRVDYTAAVADWDRGRHAWAVRRVAPSVIRGDRERFHDVTTALDAAIPETHTRVTLLYHINTAFSRADRGRTPIADGRFDIELHQGLPYRPPGGGRLEVLVAVRTLMRDPRERGSLYDELLTVAPPMRLMGGVQMKF